MLVAFSKPYWVSGIAFELAAVQFHFANLHTIAFGAKVLRPFILGHFRLRVGDSTIGNVHDCEKLTRSPDLLLKNSSNFSLFLAFKLSAEGDLWAIYVG